MKYKSLFSLSHYYSVPCEIVKFKLRFHRGPRADHESAGTGRRSRRRRAVRRGSSFCRIIAQGYCISLVIIIPGPQR